MPARHQPTLAEIAQHYGLLGQPPYVSALGSQGALAQTWAQDLTVPSLAVQMQQDRAMPRHRNGH